MFKESVSVNTTQDCDSISLNDVDLMENKNIEDMRKNKYRYWVESHDPTLALIGASIKEK